MEILEERIKRLRNERGWSTTELGNKVKKSQSTISGIEHGKPRLTVDDLSLFAKAFGVTEYFLLTGTSDENRTSAKELGLSQKTIENIKNLDSRKKALLEMLINDEGLILDKVMFEKYPDLEPECGFMDAFSGYVCDPAGNQIVKVDYDESGTEEDPFRNPTIRRAPNTLMVQLADGSLHTVDEWKPDCSKVIKRLKAIKTKYLKSLKPIQYIPTEEEEDDE